MMVMDIEQVAGQVVDGAVKVHRALGPGLLESAYQTCLVHEMKKRWLSVECEVVLPIIYDGEMIDTVYRIDMIVDRAVVIENKTVDSLLALHAAQLRTYIKLGGYKLGFLLNWNVKLMKDGIKRLIYNHKSINL